MLAEKLGWVHFFLLTTVVTIPALLLLVWIERRENFVAAKMSAGGI